MIQLASLMRFWTRILTLAIFLGFCIAMGHAEESLHPQSKQIVILYTHRPLAPICSDWDRGIRAALSTEINEPIDIEIEYLNLTRFNDQDYLRCWIELLKAKYANHPPDLIIPVYIPALQFLLEQRGAVFPDIPIVFCSVPPQLAETARAQQGVTGVTFQLDIRGTLEILQQQHPASRRLMVLSGWSPQEQPLHDGLRKMVQELDSGMEIELLHGLPERELLNRLRSIEPSTPALMLSYDEDSQGNHYMTAELTERITQSCKFPLYGLYETLLGHGIVGGRLVSAETQGKLAGQLALRVLSGERPEDIETVGLGDVPAMFDARQLNRFNLANVDLPSGAVVVNDEPTAWEQFGIYFLLGSAGILMQVMIIIVLLVNRARRMKAEKEARDLAGRILTVQEDERRYLAREMHDDLSQRLAASAIVAGNLRQQLRGQPETQEALGQLGGNLVGICDDMHRLSRQMSPAILDDFGLSDALRAECDQVADRDGIDVEYHNGNVPKSIPKAIELGLYRIAQEALWNASKYAETERVIVELKSEGELIGMDIRDFGRGFDPSLVSANQGLGLASMRERARLLGGTIKIDSSLGAGVSISVRIPLREQMA